MAAPAAPLSLSRYLTEDPKKIHESQPLMPKLIHAAYCISLLAAVAITGGILATYLGLLGTSTVPGWAVLASLTGSSLYSAYIGLEVFPKREKIQEVETRYERIAKKLEEIGNWGEQRIREFLETNGIDANQYAQVKTLLPLIARYLVAVERAEEASKLADKGLANKDEHRKYAHQALAYKTEAAFYLQCLKEPSDVTVPATESDQVTFVQQILRTPNVETAEADFLNSELGTHVAMRAGGIAAKADKINYFLKRTLLTESNKRDPITDAGLKSFKNNTPEQLRVTLFSVPAFLRL